MIGSLFLYRVTKATWSDFFKVYTCKFSKNKKYLEYNIRNLLFLLLLLLFEIQNTNPKHKGAGWSYFHFLGTNPQLAVPRGLLGWKDTCLLWILFLRCFFLHKVITWTQTWCWSDVYSDGSRWIVTPVEPTTCHLQQLSTSQSTHMTLRCDNIPLLMLLWLLE